MKVTCRQCGIEFEKKKKKKYDDSEKESHCLRHLMGLQPRAREAL